MPPRSRNALWFSAGVALSSCAVYEETLVRPTVDAGQGAMEPGGMAPESGRGGNAERGGSTTGGTRTAGTPAVVEAAGGDEPAKGAEGGSSGATARSWGGEDTGSLGGLGGVGAVTGGGDGSEGGTPANLGGAGASACSDTSVGSGLLGSIDDFDDGNSELEPIDGRSGSWLFVTDGTGTTTPAPGAPVPVTGGVSGNALHLQGSGLTGDGALLHATLTSAAGCYDASAYRGVNVALKGTGELWLVIRTALVDAQPAEKRDYHRVKYGASGAWMTYTILWSQLAQAGVPGATKLDFDPSAITGIDLVPASNTTPLSFDFWLDNVAFRKKA
jgi:hypothetical protein